jgi:hypothetical protein
MFNWIAVVKMDKKINQISLVNINNHFRSDCNIENDQDFRKFSRTIRLKPKQKHEIFQNFVFKLSKNASASRRFDFLRSKDLEKLPTLENKIREILDGPVETVGRTTRTNSFSGQTKEKSSSPNGRS